MERFSLFLIETIGKWGNYQLRLSSIIILNTLIIPSLILIIPFQIIQPKFYFYDDHTISYVYNSSSFCKEEYYKKSFSDMKSNIIISPGITNWASDLKLVCNSREIFSMVATAFFIGCVAGNLSLGKISDIYGRRKIFLTFMITNFIALFQILFLFHYIQLIISAFLLGLSNIIMGIGTVLITENIDKTYCARIMGITNGMFPLGGLLNTLLFYLFNNWRVYFYFITFISFTNTLVAFIYLQESLKWLQHNNKHEEFIEAIRYIVKVNGKEYNESKLDEVLKDYFECDQTLDTNLSRINNYSNSIHRDNEDQLDRKNKRKDSDLIPDQIRLGSSYNIIDLFIYKSIRGNSLCMFFLWIVSGFSFYGILLNLSSLTGDIYVNSVVAYSGELLGEVISGYLADLYGRKAVKQYSFSIGCICSLGFILFSINFIRIPLLFLSVMGIASAFNVLYIYSAEMYPTNIKSLAMSFFSISNNLSAATTPYFLMICPDILILIGFLSAGATTTTFFLPESMGYNAGKDVKERHKLVTGLREKLLD